MIGRINQKLINLWPPLQELIHLNSNSSQASWYDLRCLRIVNLFLNHPVCGLRSWNVLLRIISDKMNSSLQPFLASAFYLWPHDVVVDDTDLKTLINHSLPPAFMPEFVDLDSIRIQSRCNLLLRYNMRYLGFFSSLALRFRNVTA